MSEQVQSKILNHLKSANYRPVKPQTVADQLKLADGKNYHAFRDALRELMHAGRVVAGASGTVMLPTERSQEGLILGAYRHNKRGFGFVVPTDPSGHEDLFIPEGHNNGAMGGDIVRAKITNKSHRDGKAMFTGKITEIVERTQKRFVGSLAKISGEWVVLPDGNMLTEAILTPDAASRHIKIGTKVVVELTTYPGESGDKPKGVITEVLGAAGEKDVDLKAVIVQFNLPGEFPDEVKQQARAAIDSFDPEVEREKRLDLTDQIVCTIDPDDAKDYDDAISLRQLKNGYWELGVHIADVSYFVPEGTALDLEAAERGNSCYFPGYVIPMLPEILSNGVCSLQEAVPRLCKSAFITYDEDANPVGTKFANTIINSRKRLRYKEAQAILDRAKIIPHPQGDRTIKDYEPDVVELLFQMDTLAKRLHKRRLANGQITLDLPDTELVLDEEGKVVDAVPEDQSFTHTLIEMFMVEANEAVARLLDSLGVPFLRRTHPEPVGDSADRLRNFVQVAGFKLPKDLDRKAIQTLLASVKGKPESFTINLAVLKSLTRAEYSPKPIGHYALASEFYGHFTSPIRRYADLTIHRLLDRYFEAREKPEHAGGKKRKKKIVLHDVPSFDQLIELGKHLGFTERRGDDAERELRQVKLLELLKNHVGEEFPGTVTGITNFGIFIQLQTYLIDGLIRYENLLDDWWDVDDRHGVVRGQRTGTKIGIGDQVIARIAKVDPARRELDLIITQLLTKTGQPVTVVKPKPIPAKGKGKGKRPQHGGGATARNARPKSRRRRK
jgi:ribonuclease R